jgi:hypothetical protein
MATLALVPVDLQAVQVGADTDFAVPRLIGSHRCLISSELIFVFGDTPQEFIRRAILSVITQKATR